MKAYSIIMIAAILVIVTSISGCCCCCGVDGFTSKYQKSIEDIEFPSQLTVGGTTYDLVESTTFRSQDDCVKKFISNSREEGISIEGYEDLIPTGAQLSGIYEAKEFVYRSASGDKIKGFVGKSGSPGQLSGVCTIGKQTVAAVGEIVSAETPALGDESACYSARLPNGKTGYATASRYSNLFIYAYSYDSYDATNEAVRSSIDAILQTE
ncbi:hypothetical protein [Methanocella sp. MCL-LM]|uniref:hypothetical protein n=1 Tax=Methanocella sp. MCL-LM TaxID=3412035 RepID=UPI003C75090C